MGQLINVVIPRPATDPGAPRSAGLGKVFLQYADLASAAKARATLHGARRRAVAAAPGAASRQQAWCGC